MSLLGSMSNSLVLPLRGEYSFAQIPAGKCKTFHGNKDRSAAVPWRHGDNAEVKTRRLSPAVLPQSKAQWGTMFSMAGALNYENTTIDAI